MTASPSLREVLDRATDRDRRIDLWWRDDDAVAPGPALDRLLALSQEAGAPVAIAAIAARANPSLAERLAGETGASVLVHGWRHANHAVPGAKQAEFGADRPLPEREAEAGQALAALDRLFGPRLRPVFVPPWNRIGADLVRRLGRLGYAGVSAFGRRTAAPPALRIVNTHLDPVDWRGGRGPVGEPALAAALSAALADGGPVGLLTHHLAFDAALWRETAELVERLSDHPATRWTGPESLWSDSTSLNCGPIGDLTCDDEARGGPDR